MKSFETPAVAASRVKVMGVLAFRASRSAAATAFSSFLNQLLAFCALPLQRIGEGRVCVLPAADPGGGP